MVQAGRQVWDPTTPPVTVATTMAEIGIRRRRAPECKHLLHLLACMFGT